MNTLTSGTPVEVPTAPESSEHIKKGNKNAPEGQSILSLCVSDKLARQLKLLAKVEDKTLSALIIEAVEKDLPARLRAAISVLQSEVE